jgi:hypothetical protein
MRKRLVFLFSVCSLVLIQTSARAQLKGFSIGPYVEGALPVGNFEKTHQYGIGAGLSADVKIPLTKFGVTASAGYMHFEPKEGIIGGKFNAIPVRVGLKYRFSLLYAKLEGGVASITDGGGSSFLFSPGLGVRILGLDIQAKYEKWAKNDNYKGVDFAGLKVGYNF